MGEWGRTRQGGRAASASAVVSPGQTALSLSLSLSARARPRTVRHPPRQGSRAGRFTGSFRPRARVSSRRAPLTPHRHASRRAADLRRRRAALPTSRAPGAANAPRASLGAPACQAPRPCPPNNPPSRPAARAPVARAGSAARRRRRRAPPAAHMPAAALRCACRLPPGAPAAVFLAATRVLATARHRARASMGRSRPQLWPSPTDGYKCRGTIRPLSEGLGVSAASLRVGAVAAPAPLPLVLPPRFPTTGAGPRPGHSTVDTPSVRPDQPQPEHRGQRCICCPPVRWRDFAAAHAADRGARPVRTQAPPRRRREANSMAPAASRTTS